MSRVVSASLTDPRAKSTAYLDDAASGAYLGPCAGAAASCRRCSAPRGRISALKRPIRISPGRWTAGTAGRCSTRTSRPRKPGIYKLAVELDKAMRPVADLQLVTMVPFAEKKKERIGLYYLGSWPYEGGGTPALAAVRQPQGFIEVTRENKDTHASEHFTLGEFLTKDQHERLAEVPAPRREARRQAGAGHRSELKAEGVDVDHVHVMSGFRTPRYNKGGGNTGGRANLSRHMYGDGADVYVDNDRNGAPDDITGDGRVDTADAETIRPRGREGRGEATPPSSAGSGSTRPAAATVRSPTSTPAVTAPDGAGPVPG